MSKLSQKQVEAEATQLQSDFRARNEAIKSLRELVNMEREVFIPQSMKKVAQEVRTPFARDLIQRITPVLVPDSPRFRRLAIDPSNPKDSARSDAIEKWADGLHRALVRKARRDFVFMAAQTAARDGVAVLKFAMDNESWSGLPDIDTSFEGAGISLRERDRAKRKLAVPFLLFDIDPLTYFPVRTHAGNVAVFEVKHMDAQMLATQFGVRRPEDHPDKLPGKAQWQIAGYEEASATGVGVGRDTYKIIEYWSPEQFMLIVDEEVVIDQDNPYGGRLPYFDFQGIPDSQTAPERWGVSALFAIQYLVPLLDSLLTMKHNVAFSEAYPVLIKHLDSIESAAAEDIDEGLVYETGRILEERGDEQYRYLDRGTSSQDLMQMVEQITQLISVAGVADVMRGMSPGANSPGWLVSQLTDNAKAAFRPIRDGLVLALSEAYEFMLYVADQVLVEDIPVKARIAPRDSNRRWVSIGPTEIDGYYDLDVIIPGGTVSDKVMKGQFWSGMHQAGYVSKSFVREEGLELEQPAEEERILLFEQLKDMLMPSLLQRAAQEAGFDDLLAMQLGQQMSATGQGPEALLPGGMRVPGVGMSLTPDMMNAISAGLGGVGAAAPPGAPQGTPGGGVETPTAARVGLSRSRGPSRSGTARPGGPRGGSPPRDGGNI